VTIARSPVITCPIGL